MAFDVAADSYDLFMGRYSKPLARQFIQILGIEAGGEALDVGCGPGALTELLAEQLGAEHVQAVDPSRPFLDAVRQRVPGVQAVEGVAEHLPFESGRFDVVTAQLVVHFMSDPVAALKEMARVAKPRGVVGATVWDHAGTGGPLNLFWRAVRELHPDEAGEANLAGTAEGQLADLFGAAGFAHINDRLLRVTVAHESFDEWWTPFTLGVGPAGEYVTRLAPPERARLEQHCRALVASEPFEVTAAAWCVTARLGRGGIEGRGEV